MVDSVFVTEEVTFDVHRHLLYQALHWQFPENPAEERQRGEEMTQYLWRGANS